MNYGKITFCDPANGIGCRTVLFVSGCRHHCKGCFNPETWDFDYGWPITDVTKQLIIYSLKQPGINGLTLLGGEPMDIRNQPEVYRLLYEVKEKVPEATIWVYTGYTWEDLIDPYDTDCHGIFTSDILQMVDVLVDGEFEIDKKNLMLRFRGSSNQRIIDVPETLANGRIVLPKYMD